MATNKFPGKCVCGSHVAALDGTALRVKSKWVVYCAGCAMPSVPAAEREMLGTIYWPNGMGETVCTLEYEDAVFEAQMARRELEDYDNNTYDPHDRESRDWRNGLEHKVYATQNTVDTLLSDGGHLGERITYAKADPMTALLGGGRITVAPGGTTGVAP